jgi:quercetin dioxygenase-like cupin family protein
MSRAVSAVDTAVTRRALVEGLAGLVLLASPASAQTPSGRSGPIFQRDLPDVMLKDWSVTAVEVSYAPGQASAAHRHPGITIAYVLEGEIGSKIGDESEKTYTVGQMFLETPGQLHAVSRNASSTQPARLLAILLAPKGQPLTTPEKG